MNIGTLFIPESSYYQPQDKTEKQSADTMSADARWNTDGLSLSSATKEQELTENRETPQPSCGVVSLPESMLQERGLHYIDASWCTWEEFRELCSQVLDRTEYDAVPLDDLNISVQDETEKMDCLSFLFWWSEDEAQRGNMVGCHMGKRLSGAITNYLIDLQGKTEYLEFNGKQMKVREMHDNAYMKSILLGSTYAIGAGGEFIWFNAFYADDSTAENPIIKICASGEGENDPVQIYRVVLSEVDPRNATQLELFALCVHRDKQGIGDPQNRYGDSSYQFGINLGLFSETTVQDFTEEKRDWVQALEDKVNEIHSLLESAAMNQLAQKYSMGNFSLTYKEWKELLELLEKHLTQIDSSALETEEPYPQEPTFQEPATQEPTRPESAYHN